MSDCIPVPSSPQPCCAIHISKRGFSSRRSWSPENVPLWKIHPPLFSISEAAKPKICAKASRPVGAAGSEDYEVTSELGIKGKEERNLGFQTSQRHGVKEDGESGSVDFLEVKGGLKGRKRGKGEKSIKEDGDLALIEGSRIDGTDGRRGMRSGRQMMRRSSILAKPVISMQSALSLGFVSQLWVDTCSWTVFVVEVRPNLLSGVCERFLLQDVNKVGDVVLIQDESVMEYEFEMVGLETLVGYNVVTQGRENIGKVRGYNFNIDTGVVQALELDSFGISIIPTSLVSTYGLLVEDVLEVVSDTIIVHEAAASRLQRLTKGFWNNQSMKVPDGDIDGYAEHDRQPIQSNRRRRFRRGNISSRNQRSKMREIEDDWELPMDYL